MYDIKILWHRIELHVDISFWPAHDGKMTSKL